MSRIITEAERRHAATQALIAGKINGTEWSRRMAQLDRRRFVLIGWLGAGIVLEVIVIVGLAWALIVLFGIVTTTP